MDGGEEGWEVREQDLCVAAAILDSFYPPITSTPFQPQTSPREADLLTAQARSSPAAKSLSNQLLVLLVNRDWRGTVLAWPEQ